MYYPQPQYRHPVGNNPYASPRRSDRGRENSAQDDRGVRRESEKEPEVSPLLGLGGNKPKSDKMAYRRDLERQMNEKKSREVKDKLTRESFEKQKNTEIYDPFGKGGCGAPVRDQFGNLVADLKQMRKINENRLSNTSPLSHSKDGKEGSESPVANSSPRTTILTYSKDNEDKKVATLESYRDYLQRQVKEKEEVKRKEKERLRLEEEKELEQLEKDRKRLQEEYQQELKRQRRKEEEARSKNEEIKKQAEIKRQLAIMQQEQETLKEESERRVLAERRLEAIGNLSFSPSQPRAESPPIPTLRHKMKQFSEVPPRTPNGPEPNNFRSSSPPIPTLRKKQARLKRQDPGEQIDSADSEADSRKPVTESRQQPIPVSRKPIAGSRQDPVTYPPHPQEVVAGEHSYMRQPRVTSGGRDFATTSNPQHQRPLASPETEQNTLLAQLGAIRLHLQTELAKQASQERPHSDIFEKAKQQKPKIAAPRPKDSATVNALNDFTRMKNESSQRGDFLEDFPEDPDSVSMLELQQQALLHHQQNMLQKKNGRQRRQRDGAQTIQSPMLSADTSQVSRNPFADSASIGGASLAGPTHRSRRQWGEGDRVQSPGGRSKVSISTLEVEDMAARNEERLRRLEAILNSGSARRDTDSSSLGVNYFPPSATTATARPGRGTISRESELSLDCDTQHLPVQ